MKIEQLVDMKLLKKMVDDGYVRFGTHNEFPELRIYEYTAKAMFEREWNSVTMKTRGLIVNWETGEVLARPFDKFFNYGEPSQLNQIHLEMDDEVEVYDKVDGSLGILYRRPDGFLAIATKGSFHSEQAEWATKEIRKYMTTHFRGDGLTWLFEIVYPANRIVVDYGDFEGLVLLGARDIDFGDTYAPDELPDWKWRKATHFRYKTLREALEATPRPNAEGFVVYLPKKDVRIKVKQEDYLVMHRLISLVNEQYVYDALSTGKSMGDIVGALPDEFREFVENTVCNLQDEFMRIRSMVLHDHTQIYRLGMTKKEYAKKVLEGDYKYSSFMFSLFDKNPKYLDNIWKTLSPKYQKKIQK